MSEAIKAGMVRARERGVHIGRPRSGREPEVEALLLTHASGSRIRKTLGVGSAIVRRVRDRLKQEGRL